MGISTKVILKGFFRFWIKSSFCKLSLIISCGHNNRIDFEEMEQCLEFSKVLQK